MERSALPVAGRVAWYALLAALYLFLLAPILVVVVVSFDTRPYLAFPPAGWSLDAYARVFRNAAFIAAFGRSVLIGAGVGVLAVAIGAGLALAFVRRGARARAWLDTLVAAPLLVPHVALAMGMLLVLARAGWLDSYAGVVLAHLGITLPYVVRTIGTSLLAIDPQLEEAARVHGADTRQVLLRVVLPLIRPGLVAAGVMAFLVSFDEVTLTLFIVSTRVATLPTALYHYLEYSVDPQVAALSVLLIGLSIVTVVVVERLVGLRRAL